MSRRVSASLFVTLMAIFVVGCGKSGAERVVVSGTVQFQGKPIERGEIRLFPKTDSASTASGSPVSQGSYRIASNGGVTPGEYRIEVLAFNDEVKSSKVAPNIEVAGAGKKQFLPAEFNKRSKLTLKVSPQPSELLHNLDLR